MSEIDLVSACVKNEETAKKQFFDLYCPTLGYIALRYSKNKAQADDCLQEGFKTVYNQLTHFKNQQKLTIEAYVKHEFILRVVNYIKNIRNEYYVASTVKAVETSDHTYDLFKDSKFVDLRTTSEEVLLHSIQELVPSQRLAFNLSVIDGYSLLELSDFLETSEQAIKSNIEKAKFNLQKTIEKKLKHSNYGQSI